MNPVTIRGKDNRTNRDIGVVFHRLHIGVGGTWLKQVSVTLVDEPDVEPASAEETLNKIKGFAILDERDFIAAIVEIFPEVRDAFKI